jgi:hypothetical protein
MLQTELPDEWLRNEKISGENIAARAKFFMQGM